MKVEPKIIYEDNHIIVVIKPHNIAVQADSSGDIDMLTIVKNYIKERDEKPGNVFLCFLSFSEFICFSILVSIESTV